MSIIDFKINGRTFYTHETWLSYKQRLAWNNIPIQNKKLAKYYALSTLSIVAIGHTKIPFLPAYFKRFTFYPGVGLLSLGIWLGWQLIMKFKTHLELNKVIERNDCLLTPFWSSPDPVVNLRQMAKKDNFAANRYLNRKNGAYSRKENILKFNPDLILEHPKAKQIYSTSQ